MILVDYGREVGARKRLPGDEPEWLRVWVCMCECDVSWFCSCSLHTYVSLTLMWARKWLAVADIIIAAFDVHQRTRGILDLC